MSIVLSIAFFSIVAAAAAALVVTSILRSRHAATLAGAQRAAADAVSQARIEAASLRDPASRVSALEESLRATAARLSEAQQARAALESTVAQIPELKAALAKSERELLAASERESDLKARVATLETTLRDEREAADKSLAVLKDAQASMTDQFKNLANQILEEKAKRFTEQNQTNLGQLLDPLKTQLTEFKSQVERVYETEGKERSALAGQVKQLMELNQTLSEKANNLTRALQGSSKAQGNWGELILERLLENAGLREGEEYVLQESFAREDGSRALPDVIVQLPNERSLVIDAKVSLNAYEEYASSEDGAARDAARKRHLESLRNHIRGLAERNYQTLHQLKSLDCVVMFIPIEPAFMLAVTSDRDLFQDAWNRNVLLVSPSTLMFVIRTVAHLWRQEAQNRNAQAIASRGADLYDKFAAFVADLEDVGKRLKQAETSYEEAHRKLATGRGNLVRQAQMLRDLGVKPTKALPANLLDRSEDAVDAPAALPAAEAGGEGV